MSAAGHRSLAPTFSISIAGLPAIWSGDGLLHNYLLGLSEIELFQLTSNRQPQRVNRFLFVLYSSWSLLMGPLWIYYNPPIPS